MTKLKIARGLELDADYVGGGTFALLAKKGAGKTYTGRVMAEEFWEAKVPFVVLDPMGAWWGLRSSADGDSDGIPVAIFGGDHADAPLERTGGTLMADLVVEEGLSMILDMRGFGTRAAERQFALDFLERLYRRNRDLVHLFIDEADLFAPQKPQAGDQPLLGVTENIVRRGRNNGIGCTLITQRSAVLNKDVLTQVDGLVAMRMLSPQDRNAIDAWVQDHGDMEIARSVKASLPELSNGECWWWIPELDVLKRVQVRRSRTFDSSPTKKRGERRRQPKSFADIDLSAIEAKMADTIERAKAEDPKELRRRIAQLERELKQRPTEKQVETKVETVEVPVLDPGKLAVLNDIVEELAGVAGKIVAATNDVTAALGKLKARPPAPAVRQPAPTPRPQPQQRSTPTPWREPSGDLTAPQQRVLDALAWLEAVGFPQPTKIQVGFIAGYRVGKRVGGTFGNILGQLRGEGLIDYPAPALAQLTDDGRQLATMPDIEQTSEGLQQAVYARLDGPERRVLEVLVEAWPDALSKQDVGTAAGYTVGDRVGGTFGNILGRLRSLGLIDYPSAGLARAEDVLFLERAA
jgi:uncharacterized protein